MNTDSEKTRLSPTLLLLSDEQALASLVRGIVQRPWKLVWQGAAGYVSHKVFTQPNVRLVVLDDRGVEESDRGWLLAQIRKHFPGVSLLYVADSQSDANEKRARTSGAHYYVSRPLPLEQFGQVLRSFLKVQQMDRTPSSSRAGNSEMSAREAAAADPAVVDEAIHSLSVELNREDSELRSRLLDAALAGLRLERNPESLELRRDAAQLWAAIEPILSHHLDAEDNELLPWLEQKGSLSREARLKVCAYHDRLRTLIDAMANAGADRLPEAEAREVGRALSGLAVNLDDAIDDEERRLFPRIRKALLEMEHRS